MLELPGQPGPQGPQGAQGAAGAAGPQGPAGPGVPAGGTPGQYLKKGSAADYDGVWSNVQIADVVNLQTTLNAKLAATNGTAAGLTVTDHTSGLKVNLDVTTASNIAGLHFDVPLLTFGDFFDLDPSTGEPTDYGHGLLQWNGTGGYLEFVRLGDGANLPQRATLADGSSLRPGTYTAGGGTITVDASGNVTFSAALAAAGGLSTSGSLTIGRSANIGVYVAGNVTGTFAIDASLASQFDLTLTGNLTLANPTNATAGQTIVWRLTQDATGGRTVTLGTKFRSLQDVAVQFNATASKTTYLTARYSATDDKFDVVACLRE